MSARRAGRMSAGRAGLARVVKLEVPAERAFAAVGTAAGIRGWWTPLVSGTMRRGALLTLRFGGLEETIRFRVEERRAPAAVRWLCLGHDSLEEWAGTRLWFTVRSHGRTRSSLEMLHEGLVPSLACYASCRSGWDHFLASLSAWAETGRGEPFGAAARSERSARSARGSRSAARPAAANEPSGGDAAYAALARAFEGDPSVTPPNETRGKFGANGLRVDGKIFAMSVRGALVVKLPRNEIDDAVAAGRGERLSMGRGRVMKEWLVVHEAEDRWPAIARRARAFVAGDR